MAATEMTSKYEEEIGAIKSNMRALKDNIYNLADRIGDDASTGFATKKREAEASLRSTGTRLKETGAQNFDKVNKGVAAHPFITLAATLAAGVLASKLLRR